ncbi:Terminal uridylyltransferase 4 [Chionoecetes opilio]|uniref:Terminal uridylyltransferase 4 n=1 Tax=Chionoecetes opilio TaxID=41210 RepID=A0A8J5CFX8_CHIOP|nr:Terminal uridylyltransferase 4 [Chionoecetes opilio]
MDGASGGGESRGGGWTGGVGYDATNQIKQLLRIPMDDPGTTSEERSIPSLLAVAGQKQAQSPHAFEKTGSPSSKQQSWEANRYQDNRRRVESPIGGNPRHMNFDRSHNSPFRNYDNRHLDHYGSPSRGVHRQPNYEGLYNSNSNYRNPHHNQPYLHRASGGPLRDNKDPRMNGPRPLGSAHNSPIIVGAETESPEFRPSPEVLAELEEQFLFPLKKKSLRFPKAKYFCRLCDYHCDSLVVCKRHITDTRHRRLKEARDLETTLKNVPSPTDVHVATIDKLIVAVSEEITAPPELITTRRKLVSQLNDLLIAKVKGCRLEMVGSSVSGICVKTSDVNIDIMMDGNQSPSAALLAVKELVGNNDTYINVVDDLTSSFPTMSFTHGKTGQRMVVGASSTSSKYTNQLVGDYASIDSRVPILGVAFRHWAKLCQIDDQSRGTLPPHAFPVMLVHFLQQHHPPVLPVLHILHPKPDGDVYLRASDIGDKWKTKNTECVGKLWLEMFRFYTLGFKMTEQVINVRYLQPMNKTDKAWSKKIAIEDPFLQKRNLTRTVSGNPVFEYILDRFRTSYKYFGIPQLSYGPLFLHITFKEVSTGTKGAESVCQRNRKGEMLLESIEKAGQSQSEASSECETERTEEEADVNVEGDDLDDDDDTTTSGFEADMSTVSPEDTLEEPNDSLSPNGLSSQEEEVNESIPSDLTSTLRFVTPSQAAKLMQQVKEEDLLFRFEERFLTMGQKPPLICGSCQKDGHSKAECREDELPPLKKLPPINNHFLNLLTAIFEQLTRDFEPTVQEIEERDKIVSDLENYICQFFRGVTLQLFGSSANGFGFQRSDLDICLTFDGNPKGQNIDHIKIIESLAEKLKRYRQCGHVFAITTAKVPIVKFSIRRAYLEGDLSLYNTLALQNTQLLYTYARIDRRVKCLGYAMKYFAKLCDIGDASRGSLSSYAYILMVLHYLQQCKPPVIPVLQELYDHRKPAPQLNIDGWNAWFYDNLDGLQNDWNNYRKNTDSVGLLWVNMLRYYTETFNWKDHVVTIRQLAPLSRLQKLWNSRCIAIEDPFDLSHNLGAGLSRKMNTFIMKAFIRGREVFGTAVMGCPPGYLHLVDYLFDNKQLTDGAPPNDRGCRFCGKIGHIQKDCPKKKVNMEKKEKRDRQKDRRDISRTNIEDEREESRKLAEGECNEEVKENPDKERKKPGQAISTEPVRGGTASGKSPEDVATGNSPTQTSTTSMDQSLAAITRIKRQDQRKSSHTPSTSLPSTEATNSGVNSLLQCRGNINPQCVQNVNTKTANISLKTDMPSSESVSRINSKSESSNPTGITSGGVVNPVDKNNVVTSSSVTVPRVQSHTPLGPSSVLLRGQTESAMGGSGGAAVSVPPGFQNLPHAQVQHSVQGQTLSQGLKTGTQGRSNLNYISNPQGPSSLMTTSQATVSQSPQSQEPKQALQHIKQVQEQQQLHSQQLAQPPRQWGYWPTTALPQPVHLNSKPQKQEVDKSRNYKIPTTASSQNSQPHQQQYPFSISPAALFHMASQAPSGHISAMLLPNVTESNSTSSRSGLPPSPTTTTVGLPGSGAPPPGFSAPVPINYHGQQVDTLPMNKLMIGSPVLRSTVSQADGQSAMPNTASQPFLPVSGPMPGIYVSAHTPHTYGDPSLNQQHPVFDTRHFISQQMTQGLHQNVTQGLPQGVAAAVPPGMQAGTGVSLPPPGLGASLPQGINNSVPQAVPQGMHQNLQSGVSQVTLGSPMSQGMQAVPMGHPFPPQHTYPQQGYHQMTVAGTSGYYPEYMIGDPALQSHSPSGQGPPNIPAELMPEMTFPRPEVYDHPLQALPQYLSSTMPQHQSLMAPLSQPHPNVAIPPPHPPLPAGGPAPPYAQGSLVYIDSEREGSLPREDETPETTQHLEGRRGTGTTTNAL